MVILTGLDPSEYEHPLDREAIAALTKTPGLDMLVRKAYEVGLDRLIQLQSLATSIRVTPNQFPELHHLFMDTWRTLEIKQPVEFFVAQQYALNAWAAGVETPRVTVTTELVHELTEDELRFVIGHELGHVKSQHMLYHQMGYYLPFFLSIIGDVTLGIGRLLGTGLQVAFFDWLRKSEFSADRAGLLACQAPQVAEAAFCKLAGVPRKWLSKLNLEEIEKQMAEFNRLGSGDQLLRFVGQMWNTHPWIITRIHELNQWQQKGAYDEILRQRGRSKPTTGSERLCHQCSNSVPTKNVYCIHCGAYQPRQ